MKRLTLLSLLLTLSMGASSQSLYVESAIMDLRRGHLKKAKAEIDVACKHADTRDDAKTWYYAALIYCKIGEDGERSRNLAPNWCTDATNAFHKCMQLDKRKEYKEKCSAVEEILRKNCGDLPMTSVSEEKRQNDNPISTVSNNRKKLDGTMSEVSLVVSSDGPTKAQAIDNALRSAIEQTYGTFVSANTQILNDELVKEEIVTVSSGNIQKYTEIAAVTLPNGNISVTLNVTVSLAKLISYAKSKGSECEFAGATFGANIRMYEFNKKNEEIAILNMIKQLDALRPLYDYKLTVKEPVLNKDGKSAKISFTVEAINNDHTKMAYNIIENTFNSLALTPEQVKPLQDAGFSFHEYWLYFGKWEEKISPDRGRLIYLYNQIPGEICDFMLSSFCDFKISDNNGGIFFCEIKTSCRKKSFGNHIEDCFTGNRYIRSANISTSLFDLYKSGYISFLEYEKNGIVLFTENYTLVSKEISCDVLIENLNKINKIKIEPTKTSPSTKLEEGGSSIGSTAMPQTIWCKYRIIQD